MSTTRIFVNVTSTATVTDAYSTVTTQSAREIDLTSILSYALPLSCLVITVVIMIIIGIRQRQRVLEKWTSLKRMRNTNPRFLQTAGLRRDSEFDSLGREDAVSIEQSQESSYSTQSQYPLTTIA
ncbi:unnamed protein product [Adineta ricciae]|uniref:Uncharacterized protein n=1 Tax=Adineta ricciae TaxID=249248 RepID=A0A814IJF4_ADIRI|nr:unnamed protein product [Adineta ricciae]CAF1024767.1 unnamed protein product [Adineta ricciae]